MAYAAGCGTSWVSSLSDEFDAVKWCSSGALTIVQSPVIAAVDNLSIVVHADQVIVCDEREM